ncbi:MAG: TetR family transcriptional regulator [Maritimibacter sp.]|nr:TetR family transcriptional regulator [Maritimibacter sp.]
MERAIPKTSSKTNPGVKSEARSRLRAGDWLGAGLAALETAGPTALAAEPLARKLGTTKGSFYWHFQDVPSFRTAVAAAWAARARAALDSLPADLPHTDRLLRLSHPDPAEASMRAWARQAPAVATIVATVDADRRRALSATLAELGLTNPEFAQIVQAAVIGMETLGDTAPLTTLLAAILALQEA